VEARGVPGGKIVGILCFVWLVNAVGGLISRFPPLTKDTLHTHGLIERIATDDLQALSRGLTAVLAAARAEADAVRSADDAPEG
ncbi:hypothetical protein, partial [Isoptericola sp. NPDC056134]|uniref:hypothetical protein n=1 Tax=Isoptericola sp. NPDC056134 TaxID=3345723 RepID=UPI0035ED8AA4